MSPESPPWLDVPGFCSFGVNRVIAKEPTANIQESATIMLGQTTGTTHKPPKKVRVMKGVVAGKGH